MSGARRVVITGLGVVAPSGIGKDMFWSNTINGKSCVRRITRFDPKDHASQIAGEIDGFEPEKYIDRRQLKRTDLSTQYAFGAAAMALEDSGLDLETEDAERIGMIAGIATFGIDYTEQQFHNYFRSGLRGISPYTTIAVFCCASVGQVSIHYGFKGHNSMVSTGCTAGTVAIGDAFQAVRTGSADIMLAGGTDAPITPVTVQSFCAMKALSTRNDDPSHASRPFDRNRDGFVIAEGAGLLVLEELAHAKERNASIYGEIVGYASTCNAYHMTAPEPEGTQSARAMRMAMRMAGIQPSQIDYIQAHGSSTPKNGPAETNAYKAALGDYAYRVPISSLKSMIGHPLGASGALQAVVNCLVLESGMIPPTINYHETDPECDLDYVPLQSREKRAQIVMQNSAGFSGVNAVLILRKYDLSV